MNRGTCLDMCNFTKCVHECVCVCVFVSVCVCVYNVSVWYVSACVVVCMLEWAYYKKTKKRMSSFFFLSLLFDFVTTSIASAWSGLGAGLLYKAMYVSGHIAFGNKRVSRSSQMNLCKWLFDNEASLICQLCLLKQTLPCRATQSLESTDSTGEIKTSVFSLSDGTQVWLRSLELSALSNLPVRPVASLIQLCEV